MKHLTPTLAILAITGLAPAFGANFADDLTLKPKAVIQVRDQLGASGTDSAGNDYNIYNGANGGTDVSRISYRRARFGVEASNSTGWGGLFQVRAGERADAGAAPGTGQAVTLYYAYINKTWKTDQTTHTITGGLYKSLNNETLYSSSAFLFPQDRAVCGLLERRNPGIGYWGSALSMINWGIDLQHGSKVGTVDGTYTSQDATTKTYTGLSTESNGLAYSFRVDFAPTPEMMPKKRQESYCGGEGMHFVLGFDFQSDPNQITPANAAAPANTTNGGKSTKSSITMYGPDLLFHFNGLTVVADYRMRETKKEAIDANIPAANDTSYDKVKGAIFDLQAGYAFSMEGGWALEPAIRYGKVDRDKDIDDGDVANANGSVNTVGTPYSSGEWDGKKSGSEWGIGLNFYWNGHANKTQLAFTSWTGEGCNSTSGSAPKAKIFTIQHQITF